MPSDSGSHDKKQGSCDYCGGRLDVGYHFACHVCEKTYCYVHMTKHSRAHPRPAGVQLQEIFS